MSKFAENIREMRLKLHLTQKEMAQKIGISQGNLRGLEAGKFEPASTVLMKFAAFFNVEMENLMGDVTVNIIDDTRDLTSEEAVLLDKFNRLTPHNRKEILAIINLKLDIQDGFPPWYVSPEDKES